MEINVRQILFKGFGTFHFTAKTSICSPELSEVANIIRKSKKSKAMIYAHINELKKEGYITENMEITDTGRICIL